MKILTVHNRYRYRGGEDESREAEDTLLDQNGHEIRQIIFDNAEIKSASAFRVGLRATWSHRAYTQVRDTIALWRPDILDVHNFFPLASPSIYYAARKFGVPVVQTLHNYRLLCPGATFFRNGAVCEDCTTHLLPWPAVWHGCYRGSAVQSGAVALMTTAHRLIRTWSETVALYFALSEFAKRKFVENGLPESRISVKPNFVVDPGQPGRGGEEFLYVGRLSPEKGIHTMLQAIALTRSAMARFRIIGEGPLEPEVREAALQDSRITYCGRLPLSNVMLAMGSARAVLVPSEWYETFGRVAAEALAVGTPVICAGLGGVSEIVEHGKTGLHVRPRDPSGLARVLDAACANPGMMTDMRTNARDAYEALYTPARNYQLMMKGYRQAIATRSRVHQGPLDRFAGTERGRTDGDRPPLIHT